MALFRNGGGLFVDPSGAGSDVSSWCPSQIFSPSSGSAVAVFTENEAAGNFNAHNKQLASDSIPAARR